MAHVHGDKMVDAAKKIAEEATCPMMMESGMGGMMEHGAGMGVMMGPGMGGMMEHGAGMGMGGMVGSGMGMGTMMSPGAITSGVATGAVVTASSAAGRSLFGRLLTHPLVVFGAGLAIGYLIHKYREEIIEAANRAAEKRKGFKRTRV